MKERACLDCGTRVSKASYARCRRCANIRLRSDPAVQEKRLAGLASAMSTETWKTSHQAGCKRAAAVESTERRAIRVRVGRVLGSRNFHHAHTPESRAKAGASIRAHHLAWCPPEYWPLNAQLKAKGYRLAERKQLIATEMLTEAQRREAAERARIAGMSKFERDMEALRNGARLIDKPIFRRADPMFTLGGVSANL